MENTVLQHAVTASNGKLCRALEQGHCIAAVTEYPTDTEFDPLQQTVILTLQQASYEKVSSPDLIVYCFQYNAQDTESDPRSGWFGVWD